MVIFSPRHARALPQEFYLPPQFLCDFGKLNFYKKVGDILIIKYEAIFMLGFISKGFNLVVMSEVLQCFFHKSEDTP